MMIEPSGYSGDLEEQVVLPNHRLLRIRPCRCWDSDTIRELYSRLSSRTRYLRFLCSMPVLPDPVLKALTCADDRRCFALLAELEQPAGANAVALGNLGAIDAGTAELAVVVRDDYQRQGIGTALASKLLQAGEVRGFKRFVAHVLWENSFVIRRLLNRADAVVCSTTSYGVSDLSFVRR